MIQLQWPVVAEVAQARVNATVWVRFPLEEMKYIIFSFLSSRNYAKNCVEFRHSTRYASELGGQWGTEVSQWIRKGLKLDS